MDGGGAPMINVAIILLAFNIMNATWDQTEDFSIQDFRIFHARQKSLNNKIFGFAQLHDFFV